MPTKYLPLGTKVKIIEGKRFIRCGYPLNFEVVRALHAEEITKKINDMALAADLSGARAKSRALEIAGIKCTLEEPLELNEKVRKSLENAVCYDIIRRENFGGCRRAVYEEDDPNLVGVVADIVGKKLVKTGIRYGGYDGGWGYDGDYDYEPPSLEDVETHCVYTLECCSYRIIPYREGGLRVLASRVEEVK